MERVEIPQCGRLPVLRPTSFRMTPVLSKTHRGHEVEPLGPTRCIGGDPGARPARANQWQQITKHLSLQLNRIFRSVACPGRRSPLPAFALDPGRYVSIKQDKKCAEPASGPRACSATKKRFG